MMNSMEDSTASTASGSEADSLAETHYKAFDILHFSDVPQPLQQMVELDSDSLPAWFEKDINMPSNPTSQSRKVPSGGLKVLILTYKAYGSTEPFLKAVEKAKLLIKEYVGAPVTFWEDTLWETCVSYCFSPAEDSTRKTYGFVLKFPFARERTHGQLALVYDRQNRISRVLLLSSALLPVYEDSFFEILQDDSLYCSHPLVVPLALVKVVLDWSCSRLDDMERELNRITELTGQHRWPRVPTANPLQIDFLATTADLNDVGRIVSSEAAILASVILALQKSRDFAAAIEQLDTKERANLDKGLNNDTLGILMEERVDYFIQLCRSLLIQAEYIEKRNGTLMQVVYQFMAQKDAKVNIALAESSAAIAKASKEDSAVMKTIALESKKDSSAMKTISILGMIFLPGTFVAAIFAMPVFDWGENGAPIVKPALKFYVAVTLPMTFVVLLTWSLAVLLPWKKWIGSNRKKQKEAIE